jgi:hypothetical protein
MHHFENIGLYDGLFVMQDTESKTLWNHMTGEALYGPQVGRVLGPIGNVLQITVDQSLAMDPDTRVAISDRPYFAAGERFGPDDVSASGARMAEDYAPANPDVRLSPMFTQTLGDEDTRLPRMTMGLTLVTEATVRFYPMAAIEAADTVIDQIDGRSVVLYLDPTTFTPAAVFVDTTTAAVDGPEIHLDGGRTVRDGVLYDATGTRLPTERPQQFFSRWYGVSLTYSDPEIYGQ